MKKDEENLFTDFLDKFPEINLPVTVSDDSKLTFSRRNKPLSEPMITNFIAPYEKVEVDEYTEYVPCFKIKDTHNFHAVVYWKGSLLSYQYYLASYDPSGLQLAKQKIAGIITHGDKIQQAVANIEKDWIVYVVQNSLDHEKNEIDDDSTKAYSLELLADGQIIFSLNEDIF